MIDRLRANLCAAGIPHTEADIEGIVESGMLANARSMDALEPTAPGNRIPDHLAPVSWIESERAPEDPDPHVPRDSVRDEPGGRPSGTGGAAIEAPRERGARGTIAALAPLVRSGAVSPVQLAERALERIAARDGAINAFQIVLAEQALESARHAEREIAAGRCLGPLHGIPVAVKDLLALAGTPAASGSRLFGDVPSRIDATAVARLRAAGAVIIGKTRMPEFAYSPGSNNPHFGPTANPWDLSRDSGGSSSGSGAAVADGMAIAALGTDTGGSIRIPAACCGIVGLKPTFGRTSLHGALPLAWSLDHLGPMTRSVADAALMLDVLAGPDPDDPRTRGSRAPGFAWRLAGRPGVAGLRIGALGDDGSGRAPASPAAQAAVRRGLDALHGAGAGLAEVDLPELAVLRIASGTILAIEAATHHEAALRERGALLGDFARRRLLAAYAHGPAAYVRAQQWRAALRRHAGRIFERIDVLALPTLPESAPPIGVPPPTALTAPFNALGWPAITVPAGREGRLPLGLQLVARPGDEVGLLRAAAAVETCLGPLVSDFDP